MPNAVPPIQGRHGLTRIASGVQLTGAWLIWVRRRLGRLDLLGLGEAALAGGGPDRLGAGPLATACRLEPSQPSCMERATAITASMKASTSATMSRNRLRRESREACEVCIEGG